MNESYDPGTHLLVIALIVFYWNLLRIWRQPPDSSNGKPSGKQAAAGSAKLTPIALQAPAPTADTAQEANSGPDAPAGNPLTAIHAANAGFDAKAFLAGASRAYELVVNAYAEEDIETLDSLLDPQAGHDFKGAISARRARGERLTFTFIGLKDIKVVEAWAESNIAEITVRFTSEAVSATYGPDGRLVNGNPDRVVEMTDTWTFARCLTSGDPNWQLVAT